MAKGKRNKALKKVPTEKKTSDASQNQVSIQQQMVAEQFQGPIPPPSLLEGYENLLPGSADRILAMAEKETDHRQNMEKKALGAEIQGLGYEASDTKRGQIFGLIIGVTAIISGTYAAVNGAQWAGSFIGAGGVIGLVPAFIVGRKSPLTNHEIEQEQTKEIVPVDQK